MTIVMGMIQTVMAFQQRYTTELNVPGIALENMMTCRVHRAVILGLLAGPALPGGGGGGNRPPVMFTTGITGSDVGVEVQKGEKESDASLQV